MTTLLPISGSIPSLGAAPPDVSPASTYTDVTGLEALKRDPNSPEAINAVAQQVEALFLQMMLKSMRDASAAEANDSNEMGMYQDMFDKQVALSISQHADLGIGRLLKRQLEGRSNGGERAQDRFHRNLAAASSLPTAAIAQYAGRVRASHDAGHSARGLRVGSRPPWNACAGGPRDGLGPASLPRNADGSLSNNLFGIKAGDEWAGPNAAADTMEVINGVAVQRRASFRAYGSIEESINDFANLLKNSPRYKDVIAAGGNAGAYIAAMGSPAMPPIRTMAIS